MTRQLSVIWYGKNCASTIDQTIRSIQEIHDIELELLAEDGGSTDGTFQKLATYAQADSRILIAAQQNRRSSEQIVEALQRARGEFILFCLQDSTVLLNGVHAAIKVLKEAPHEVAVVGGLSAEFDIVTLLFSPFRPSISNALFRRQALLRFGLDQNPSEVECLDFTIWKNAATDFGFAHTQDEIGTSPSKSYLFSMSLAEAQRELTTSFEIIDHLFSENGFFAGINNIFRLECLTNQLAIVCQNLDRAKASFIARNFRPWIEKTAFDLCEYDKVESNIMNRVRDRVQYFRNVQTNKAKTLGDAFRRLVRYLENKFGKIQPTNFYLDLLTAPIKSRQELSLCDAHELFSDLYAIVAPIYEERGQVELAMKMWRKAEKLDDELIDSFALQTSQKTPNLKNADFKHLQKRWVERHIAKSEFKSIQLTEPYNSNRKIRVGYHCVYFNSDTFRYLLQKPISLRDRERFEAYAYTPYPMAEDLASTFDVVRDLRSTVEDVTAVRVNGNLLVSNEKFTELVRADNIDILVELSGFAPAHRFSALSMRCAPVQVAYLNHASTSGVPNVDYFISDVVATPPEHDQVYSEEVVRLPHAQCCFDYREEVTPPIAEPPSLSNGFVTFGCYGGVQKFNGSLLKIWARILANVPGSVLRLQNNHMNKPDTRRFLWSRFEDYGISPKRILLVPGTDRSKLLDLYKEIDISLDTWPYSGGNTICESLWQGVPVVGFCLDTFGSRYGAALLEGAGCADLVATSFDDYINIATRLAFDTTRRIVLRHKLRDLCTAYGLNDSARMARSLENAFLQMIAKKIASTPR